MDIEELRKLSKRARTRSTTVGGRVFDVMRPDETQAIRLVEQMKSVDQNDSLALINVVGEYVVGWNLVAEDFAEGAGHQPIACTRETVELYASDHVNVMDELGAFLWSMVNEHAAAREAEKKSWRDTSSTAPGSASN